MIISAITVGTIFGQQKPVNLFKEQKPIEKTTDTINTRKMINPSNRNTILFNKSDIITKEELEKEEKKSQKIEKPEEEKLEKEDKEKQIDEDKQIRELLLKWYGADIEGKTGRYPTIEEIREVIKHVTQEYV